MTSVHFFSRIISSWFAFALPLFRSFQALQRRPVSDSDIERLTKYWIVVGALLAFESSVEFLVSWFPFYWEIKLLALLFISLPQLQGSTYIYDSWLAPFLSRNEVHFDRQIESARNNFLGFFQSQMQFVLDKIMGKIQATTPESASNSETGTGPISSMQSAARMAMGFLTTHGVSLAGRNDAARPAGSRSTSSNFQPSSAASTSIQTASFADANHRSGFVSGSQASLPITPEHVYQAQASKSRIPDGVTPPAFPQPEYF